MIKIIYSICVLLLSSAMYLFSSGTSKINCSTELTGEVKVIKTISGTKLIIEGENKIIYYPRIEKKGIVIADGTRVRICYETIKKISPVEELVLVNEVACLP